MIDHNLQPVAAFLKGELLDPIARLSINSYLSAGHPFHLYSYRSVESLPDGVEWHDARQILSPELQNHCSAAVFALWFRLELLVRQAPWVSSLDMVCLNPLSDRNPLVLGLENPNAVGSALMRCPPNHPALLSMLRRLRHPELFVFNRSGAIGLLFRSLHKRSRIDLRRSLLRLFENGEFFSLLFLQHPDSLLLQSPARFYPLKRHQKKQLYDDSFAARPWLIENSDAICLYSDSDNASFSHTIDRQSLLQQLLNRFVVSPRP